MINIAKHRKSRENEIFWQKNTLAKYLANAKFD